MCFLSKIRVERSVWELIVQNLLRLVLMVGKIIPTVPKFRQCQGRYLEKSTDKYEEKPV